MSLLLRRARVVPLDGTAVAAPVDVRLDGGRIAEVGRGEPLEPRVEDDVVDLDGRYVLPGLWDQHVHMTQWAMARQRLDVGAARSAEEVAALVVARLRAAPVDDGVLVGAGFRDGLWPRYPVAADLDDAIAAAGLPPTAVVVMSGDVHSGWFSTRALERFGVRSADGILREDEWFAVVPALQDAPADVQDDAVGRAAQAAAARGVVGVVDLEFADNLTAWRRRTVRGLQSLRVDAGLWEEHLDGAIGRELATGDVLPGTGGLVRVGPFKVISDGSLGTRTAFCHDAYTGVAGPAVHGALNIAPERLVALMAHAHRHGIRSAIHAIGDRAVGVALDAFAASGAHGSIEHAQMVTADDLPRFAELDVVASVQPEHLMDDRDLVERYWAGREDRVFPLRRLHDAGARLALGSDAPVAPLDPWAAIASAVDRTVPEREPWRPQDALPAWAALAASVRSRVEAGAVADLVVLDADPLAAHGAALRRMPVAGTLLAGEWTHRAF